MADVLQGTTMLAWTFDEYEQRERGTGWFVVAILAAVALLISAFATRNFLFAVLVIMVVAVLALRHTRTPEQVAVAITDKGIALDGRFYGFDRLDAFWIVEPEIGRPVLYLDPQGIRPRIAVPIRGEEPRAVREALASHLRESADQDEPGADILGKVLKL